MDSHDPPRCVESDNRFKFYDRHGNELFGSSEITETPSTTTVSLDTDNDKIKYLHSANRSMYCKKNTLPKSLPYGKSSLESVNSQSFSTSTFLYPEDHGSNTSLQSI